MLVENKLTWNNKGSKYSTSRRANQQHSKSNEDLCNSHPHPIPSLASRPHPAVTREPLQWLHTVSNEFRTVSLSLKNTFAKIFQLL
jgi:hypothetical protein